MLRPDELMTSKVPVHRAAHQTGRARKNRSILIISFTNNPFIHSGYKQNFRVAFVRVRVRGRVGNNNNNNNVHYYILVFGIETIIDRSSHFFAVIVFANPCPEHSWRSCGLVRRECEITFHDRLSVGYSNYNYHFTFRFITFRTLTNVYPHERKRVRAYCTSCTYTR